MAALLLHDMWDFGSKEGRGACSPMRHLSGVSNHSVNSVGWVEVREVGNDDKWHGTMRHLSYVIPNVYLYVVYVFQSRGKKKTQQWLIGFCLTDNVQMGRGKGQTSPWLINYLSASFFVTYSHTYTYIIFIMCSSSSFIDSLSLSRSLYVLSPTTLHSFTTPLPSLLYSASTLFQ